MLNLSVPKFLNCLSNITELVVLLQQPGEFFIVKIKAGLLPALDLTIVFKVGREPQGEIN